MRRLKKIENIWGCQNLPTVKKVEKMQKVEKKIKSCSMLKRVANKNFACNVARFAGPLLAKHKTTRCYFGSFRPFWTILDHFGPYWTMLDHFARFWTIILFWRLFLAKKKFFFSCFHTFLSFLFRPFWTNSDNFRPLWTILDHIGPCWTISHDFGPLSFSEDCS